MKIRDRLNRLILLYNPGFLFRHWTKTFLKVDAAEIEWAAEQYPCWIGLWSVSVCVCVFAGPHSIFCWSLQYPTGPAVQSSLHSRMWISSSTQKETKNLITTFYLKRKLRQIAMYTIFAFNNLPNVFSKATYTCKTFD